MRELYEKTFVLLSSTNWKRIAPSPLKEASIEVKERCFVFGFVSSVLDVCFLGFGITFQVLESKSKEYFRVISHRYV